jgi:hypothetical protein
VILISFRQITVLTCLLRQGIVSVVSHAGGCLSQRPEAGCRNACTSGDAGAVETPTVLNGLSIIAESGRI